jgi:Uma2 family endonuclease
MVEQQLNNHISANLFVFEYIMSNCDKNRLQNNKIVGIPEFIAEVISKSTSDYDYDEKRINYLKYGVKELWLVDLFENKITVQANGDIVKYTFYDEVHSAIFPNFKINFREILNSVDKDELKWYV